MVHPVLRLAASQPQLLAEHAAAYVGLVTEEIAARSALLRRRVALQFTGTVCLLVAAVLAGVAALLWASLPGAGFRAPWLMVFIPALPAALGWWFLWLAQASEAAPPFAGLRLQLARDAALLRTRSSP